MSSRIDHTLDLRGAIQPIGLLKICQVFREMHANETLEIFGRDPDTRADIFRVLPASAYELVASEEVDKGDASYRLQMRKKGDF